MFGDKEGNNVNEYEKQKRKLTNFLSVASARTSFPELDPNQRDQHAMSPMRCTPQTMAALVIVVHPIKCCNQIIFHVISFRATNSEQLQIVLNVSANDINYLQLFQSL